MPISKYNESYGGRPGSAGKALRAMIAEYGERKGRQVFYATAARRRKKRGSLARQLRGK